MLGTFCLRTDGVLSSHTAFAEQGIVGRGILVDLYSWRQKQDDPALKEFNCFETSSIPLKDIKACLAAQGTEVKFGDILFTRTGKKPPSTRTHI